MARPEKVRRGQAAVEAGRRKRVRFSHKYVQLHGTFVATVQVEGSIDGSDYFAVGAPQSAPGVVPVPETVEFVRVRTAAYTSGEPKAVLAGFDERAV